MKAAGASGLKIVMETYYQLLVNVVSWNAAVPAENV